MLDIKGSVAVITGGAGGIGFAIAKHWVENGGKVVLGDVVQEALDKAEAELKAMNGEVATIVCDVTDEDDCGKMADLAIETFGQINLVAPFAGIIKDGLLLRPSKETGKVEKKMPLDDFKKVVDINLTGVFLTVRECVERMIDNGCRGLVCLVSSTGSRGTAGQINYSSTKAAMAVMPHVLTAEAFRKGLADKIRCVAVAPGYVGDGDGQEHGSESARPHSAGRADRPPDRARRGGGTGRTRVSQRSPGGRNLLHRRGLAPRFARIVGGKAASPKMFTA